MGDYLKLFDTHAGYNTYINGQDAILPNVSYCEDQNEVHYNPYGESASADFFCKIYLYADPTVVIEIEGSGQLTKSMINSYTIGKAELGDLCTSINADAFQSNTAIKEAIISSTVTQIGNASFNGASNLSKVTVLATTPPTLDPIYTNTWAVFQNTSANLVIYVPANLVNTYKAATGWSTYANKIQAIPTT